MLVSVYIVASKYKTTTFRDKVRKTCPQCIGSQSRCSPKSEFCAFHGCRLDEVVERVPIWNKPPSLSNFSTLDEDGMVQFIPVSKNILEYCASDGYDITEVVSAGLDELIKNFIEAFRDDVKIISETYENVEFRVGVFDDNY